MIMTSILEFALFATIPTAFENVFTQEVFTTENLVNETIRLRNTSESFENNL